jgi:hypothetical protein
MNITLKIKRYNPESDEKAHWETYPVEVEPGDQLLDALHLPGALAVDLPDRAVELVDAAHHR